MSQILNEVLNANAKYATGFGDKAKLALPPARRFAILTCMDARLDPAKYAGLAEGDAHVIRNAGGRASDDAIRSLVISYKLLGTREFFVIHHTDCGMQFFTNEVIRGLLDSSLETAELTPNGFRDIGLGPGSRAGEYIEWLAIKDPRQAVLDDVARIRAHPLVPKSIPVYGYIYDVRSGKLDEIEEQRSWAQRLRDQVLVLFLLGAYHGVNPGMGWLFAVALGMQRHSSRVVWHSLVPIAAGHFLSIGLVVTIAVLIGAVLPQNYLRIFVAAVLFSLGLYRLVRRRHVHWGGMQVGFRDLTIWSFLMASEHGAGLMLLPVLLGMSAMSYGHHDAHMHLLMMSGIWVSMLAIVVHTFGYLATTGATAFIVYEKVGLNLLRRAWVNLDMIWAVALMVTAGVALLLPAS